MDTPIKLTWLSIDELHLSAAPAPLDFAGLGDDAKLDAVGLPGSESMVGALGQQMPVFGMNHIAHLIHVHADVGVSNPFQSSPGFSNLLRSPS